MIYYLTYFLLIFSTLFQALDIFSILGVYGRCFSGIFGIIVFLVLFFTGKIHDIGKMKKIWIFPVSLILCSIFFIVIYGPQYNVFEDNIVLKSIKGCIIILSIVLYIFDIVFLLKHINKQKMYKPFLYCYVFLFLVLLIEINNPTILETLHFRYSTNTTRIRLLTSESSNTGSLIFIYYLLSLMYLKESKNVYKKIFSIILITIILLFQIYYTSSKGFYLALVISLFLFIIFKKRMKIKMKLFYLSIYILFLFYSYSVLLELFISDIDNYTSMITRSYTIYCSILVAIKYPFGCGGAMYSLFLQRMMLAHVETFSSVFSEFNYSEIYNIINANSDTYVTVKSGLFELFLYIGVFGALFLLINYVKLLKSINKYNQNNIMFLCALFIPVILTIVAFELKYEIYTVIGIFIFLLMHKENKNDNIKRKLLIN